jgi:H+/Cl- antiporter ClcA
MKLGKAVRPRRSWSTRRLERWAMTATGLLIVAVVIGCIVGMVWMLQHDEQLRAAEAREAATRY